MKRENSDFLLKNSELELRQAEIIQEITSVKIKYKGLTDLEAEKEKLQGEINVTKAGFQREVQTLKEQREKALAELKKQREKGEADILTLKQQAEMDLEKRRDEAQRDLQEQLGAREGEVNTLKARIWQLKSELGPLDDEATLKEFGFYKPFYDFESSSRYQVELDQIIESQKKLIKSKEAVTCSITWTVNGSAAEGRKQINQTLRLMARAFNGECDAAIAKVRYNNVKVMEGRIKKAFDAINALAQVQQCRISTLYFELKLKELRLAHEYQEKLQAEKEEQRRIREQMRDEEIARRELEKAQQDAEKEEKRWEDALARARVEAERTSGERSLQMQDKISELERRLQEAQANKERAISRAQQTRSGHVYVISNIGSFGENVYKIGMTRRLDPMDRVIELGDASVPFIFDVHAIIFSEDAPGLEATLHRKFNDYRLNRINTRKEFFRVTLLEIAEVVKSHHGEIEFVHDAEAKHYRQSLAISQNTPNLG